METQEQAKRMNGEGSIYQDRNGYFLFSMMHEGKRLVRSLKTKDEDEATRNAVKVRNEFGGRIASGEFEPSNVKNFTVGEAIKRYLDYLNENGRASAPIVALSLGVTAPVKPPMRFRTPPSTIVSPCCARPSNWR
jgi:hypothetical protein